MNIHRVFVVGTTDLFYPTPEQLEALVMKYMCQRCSDDNVVLAVSCEMFEEDFDFDYNHPELKEIYDIAQEAIRCGIATMIPDEAALEDAMARGGGCPLCAIEVS